MVSMSKAANCASNTKRSFKQARRKELREKRPSVGCDPCRLKRNKGSYSNMMTLDLCHRLRPRVLSLGDLHINNIRLLVSHLLCLYPSHITPPHHPQCHPRRPDRIKGHCQLSWILMIPLPWRSTPVSCCLRMIAC